MPRRHHNLHSVLSSIGLSVIFFMLGWVAIQALAGRRLRDANPVASTSVPGALRKLPTLSLPDVLEKGLGDPSGEILTGRASVIDGDTLEIRGRRVRLFGVDAFESSQSCEDARGQRWAAGRVSALALSDLIGVRNISCTAEDIDVYGRVVATCSVDGVDLNRAQVLAGLAHAYRGFSHRYAAAEREARAQLRGGWAMQCQAPGDYRAAHPRGRWPSS